MFALNMLAKFTLAVSRRQLTALTKTAGRTTAPLSASHTRTHTDSHTAGRTDTHADS